MEKARRVTDKFQGGKKSWQYTDPENLLRHVNAWIDQKCEAKQDHAAKEGDSVIMVFLGYGHGRAATIFPDAIKIGWPDSLSRQVGRTNKKVSKVNSAQCHHGFLLFGAVCGENPDCRSEKLNISAPFRGILRVFNCFFPYSICCFCPPTSGRLVHTLTLQPAW